MNKPKLFLYLFIALSLFTLVLQCLRSLKNKNPLTVYDYKIPSYNYKEEYDPSLGYLSSIKKLRAHCDSLFYLPNAIYTLEQSEKIYTNIVSSVIRKRFYWGYSWYTFSDNYLSVIISKITGGDYAAIVDPDDILKHPNAACSQQSIVMMETLKRKGFKTRKVIFLGKNKVGHFACEIFYAKKWHFHDPTLEPDTAILNKYDRPNIKFILAHKDLLLLSYRNYSKVSSFMLDVFGHYKYGNTNVFPANNALIFQKTTKFFSNSIWLFFLFGAIILFYKNKSDKPDEYEILKD